MSTPESEKIYTIQRCFGAPSLVAAPGKAALGWEGASLAEVSLFHKLSKETRPQTFFRALYDEHFIYVRFDVMDTFVKVVNTALHSNVCCDSCVEFFIQPSPGPGYFNFEINAGGAMLLYYLEDVRRNSSGNFSKYAKVDAKTCANVEIHTSLPATVIRPMVEPVAWVVAYRIPLSLFTTYAGVNAFESGAVWRGNIYKCGGSDHWGMWADVGERLDFHQPDKFGKFIFG